MIEYLTSRDTLILLAKMIGIFGGVMGALAYTTLVERRLMAFVQMRPGPNRVGPFGLLQPIADGLKFLFKEQTVPGNANVLLYYAAPIVSLIPALLSFSVIPFGPDLQMGFAKGWRGSGKGALGDIEKEVLRDNLEDWTGDHIMDHESVPGVLLASRPLAKPAPSLKSLAAALLAEMGVEGDFPRTEMK